MRRPQYSVYCDELDSVGCISVIDSRPVGLTAVNLTQLAPKAAFCVKWRVMTATGPFKVTDFGTDRKPVRDFLLANNTNALTWSVSELSRRIGQSVAFDSECFCLTLSFVVNPWTVN